MKSVFPPLALILSFSFSEYVWQWEILSQLGYESAKSKSGAPVKLLIDSCTQLDHRLVCTIWGVGRV